MISDKILNARMAELGRIKIGGLDKNVRTTRNGKKWQAPVKFDSFVITGQERDESGNFKRDDSVHAIVGQAPRELKIRLLYNDLELNFRTELALYSGKSCLCRGNGESAERVDKNAGELTQVQCPCPRLDEGKCKPHGVLNCLLEEASVCGGVYRFSTTSWNTIRSIVSSLKFIQACNGGIVAGIPLVMKYFKKTTQTKDGKPTTIPVVTIIYNGSPVQMLEEAIKTEKERIQAGVYMKNIEKQAMLEFKQELTAGILEDDEIPEFHPENEPDTSAETVGAIKTIDDMMPEPETAQPEPTPEPTPAPKPTRTKKYWWNCAQCPNNAETTVKEPAPVCECGSTMLRVTTKTAMLQRSARICSELEVKRTPEPTTTEPESQPEQTQAPATALSVSEARRQIVLLRNQHDIKVDKLKDLLIECGCTKDGKPIVYASDWSEEQTFALLAAIKAKYSEAE